MKWIEAYDMCMPPKDSGSIIIRGSKMLDLKEEYEVKKHLACIMIDFYLILPNGFNYYTDNINKQHSMKNATMISLKSACCDPDEKNVHANKFKEWGLKLANFQDFIDSDQNHEHLLLTDIDRWAFSHGFSDWLKELNELKD